MHSNTKSLLLMASKMTIVLDCIRLYWYTWVNDFLNIFCGFCWVYWHLNDHYWASKLCPRLLCIVWSQEVYIYYFHLTVVQSFGKFQKPAVSCYTFGRHEYILSLFLLLFKDYKNSRKAMSTKWFQHKQSGLNVQSGWARVTLPD